jgi:hypothetical protein
LLEPREILLFLFAVDLKLQRRKTMKHEFLVCPPYLNQAFDPGGSVGGAWGNGITRRTFIKRTGGATVASLVAWSVITERGNAQQLLPPSGTGNGSCDAEFSKTNRGAFTERRKDKWTRHTNKNNGQEFWLRTEGKPWKSSGNKPPGTFLTPISFVVNGKTCYYAAKGAPALTPPDEGNWELVPGTGTPQTGNAGDTIPNPPGDWIADPYVFTEATYSRNINWVATQTYVNLKNPPPQ